MAEPWEDFDIHDDDSDPVFGFTCEKCGFSGMVVGDPPHRWGDLSGAMTCTKCGSYLGTVRSLIIKDRLASGAPLKRR